MCFLLCQKNWTPVFPLYSYGTCWNSLFKPCPVGRAVLIKSHQNNFSPHFFYVEFNSKQLLFSWTYSKNASLVGKNALFVYKGICPKIHRKNWHFSFFAFFASFFSILRIFYPTDQFVWLIRFFWYPYCHTL